MYERTYHAKVLKYDEKTPPRRIFSWRRLVTVLGVLVICAGIVILIKAPRFQVQTISVVGVDVADPIEVSQFTLAALQGNYLLFFPKTSILLVNQDKLAQEIKAHYPRFKTVRVDRDSMRSLKVTVTEYAGSYLWCDSTDVCSFMDETGAVFADAPYFSGNAYLKIYSGARIAYPFYPVTIEQLTLVSHIKKRLESIEIDPLSFAFDSDHLLSVVFIHNTSRTTIMFDPTEDTDQMLETLYGGLRTEPFTDLYHNPSKILEYIDLRFANKLIYKFK